MHNTTKCIALLALVALTMSGCKNEEKGLKDAYDGYFKIGVALSGRNLNAEQEAIVVREYNSVTCENAMKVGELHPAEGVWRWDEADRIADFCRANGLKMRGHCLCWHNQFAMWMLYDEAGAPVSKEVFYERLRDHIMTVVNRYKDVVYCWDVVNEAIADDAIVNKTDSNSWVVSPEEAAVCPYRKSFLYELCGDEFIAKAFEWAHEADPDAQLFYNDYNVFMPSKRDRVLAMVRKMKAAGVPIDGIGMQGHYNLDHPSPELLAAAIDSFATVVDHIQITELDLRISQEMGGALEMSKEGVELTEEIVSRHAAKYGEVFETLRAHSEKLDVVTFWNLTDADSWVGEANYPQLFDGQNRKKPAYEAVCYWEK